MRGKIGGRADFCRDRCYFLEAIAYSGFKRYCQRHQVTINFEDEELALIDTQNIEGLKVFRADGAQIEGLPGASISGFGDEGYEITIIGVPYPFYEEEFPHHCEAYKNQFS